MWLPERFTELLEPSVKIKPVVEHEAASAAQVATSLYELLLNVPLEPVALVQVAAFHVMSDALHVVAETTDGVKLEPAAWTETLSCLAADARTMLSIVTLALLAAVLALTLVTLNVTPAGTVTRACSETLAVIVVD